jgi:hypothetical protein
VKPVVKNLVVVESVDPATVISVVAVDSRPLAALVGGVVTASSFDPLALTNADLLQQDDQGSKKPDGWLRSSKYSAWVRVHRNPRQCLFTPTCTRSGPPPESLSFVRLSIVRFVSNPIRGPVSYNDDSEARIIDRWDDPKVAHKCIGYWVGKIWFFENSLLDADPLPNLAVVSSVEFPSATMK